MPLLVIFDWFIRTADIADQLRGFADRNTGARACIIRDAVLKLIRSASRDECFRDIFDIIEIADWRQIANVDIHVGNLTPIRDFNYVEDIAEAFVAAGTTDQLEYGIPYNAGSGTGVTIGEAAKLICDICGTNKPIENDQKRHRPEKSEVFELLADAKKFQQSAGWVSHVALRDGLSETVSWWRRQSENANLRRDRGMMY